MSFCALYVANGQAVDSNVYHLGANGLLLRDDSSSSNLIKPIRVGNKVIYGFNWDGTVNGSSNNPNFVSKQSQVIPNFLSNVKAGTATPPTINNILYNIINDSTGQQSNYVPITKFADGTAMTDADCDGIYAIKYNGKYYRLSKQQISVKDFGAKGDNVTDDYTALNNAVNTCNLWGLALYFPAGNYNFSQTLHPYFTAITGGQDPFYSGKWIGDGMKATRLHFTGHNDTAIAIIGGAGQYGGGGIYDMMIDGVETGYSTTNIGLYISERTGICTWNCGFYNLKQAVYFNNTNSNSFTEQNVMHNADFENCRVWCEYELWKNQCIWNSSTNTIGVYASDGVTTPTRAGSDGSSCAVSFHGSGLDGECHGNVAVRDNYPIRIGFDCYVYNAPLNVKAWMYDSTGYINKTLIFTHGITNNNYKGNISIENAYYQSSGSLNTLATGVGLTFTGNVQSHSNRIGGVFLGQGDLLMSKTTNNTDDGMATNTYNEEFGSGSFSGTVSANGGITSGVGTDYANTSWGAAVMVPAGRDNVLNGVAWNNNSTSTSRPYIMRTDNFALGDFGLYKSSTQTGRDFSVPVFNFDVNRNFQVYGNLRVGGLTSGVLQSDGSGNVSVLSGISAPVNFEYAANGQSSTGTYTYTLPSTGDHHWWIGGDLKIKSGSGSVAYTITYTDIDNAGTTYTFLDHISNGSPITGVGTNNFSPVHLSIKSGTTVTFTATVTGTVNYYFSCYGEQKSSVLE